MKAGVLKDVNAIAYEAVAEPQLAPGDMLVKVKAATICGTDIRILRGSKTAGIRYPSILGHEFAGEIVETGGHGQFRTGQAVCVCPQFSCGHCDYCLRGHENLCRNMTAMGYQIDGAFAEYVRIPKRGIETGNVFAMPEGLSFETAALAEPLACVMNGQDLVGVRPGDSVAVLGGGPIGLLHVQLARLAGAGKIILSDPNQPRRDSAVSAGADLTINPYTENVVDCVRSATGGAGADVAICAIGVPSLASEAIAMVRKRGRVSLFAGFAKGARAELDINAIHYDEITVTGAFGLSRLLFERALHLMSSGRLDLSSLITHRFGLSEIETAMAVAEQGKSAMKVAIV